MQKIVQSVTGRYFAGLSVLIPAILIVSSCSSNCRNIDALLDQTAAKESIQLNDWNNLVENLEKNQAEYQDCDGSLYNEKQVNKGAVLERISSLSGKYDRSPRLGKEVTIGLIDEQVQPYINEGAEFEQVKDRLENFISGYETLFSESFPELYSLPGYTDTLIADIYDSHIISPRLYLERSGSMVFYDAGNRNFVNAMRQIINRFPQYSMDKKLIYVVADKIAHWDIAYSDFLQTPNIFRETRGMVDPSFTDFPAIFRDILNNTEDNQISVLFSDLIYDVQTPATGVTPGGLASQAQEMTHAVFNTHGADFGVIILKMNGDYDGIYYPPLSSSFSYEGNRPYYISLIGKTRALHKLMTGDPYSAVKDFSSLPGFEASHSLYRMSQTPWYSIIVPHNKNSRYVQPARSSLQEGRIDRLENARIHDRENSFTFVVAADLSSLWFDESFKTNPENYRISSRDDFYVDEIIPVGPGDLSSSALRYAGESTHLIVLRSDQLNNPRQEITIDIVNEFPGWLEDSSTLNDTEGNLQRFEHTTFGLEQMVKGIHNAFYQGGGNSIISLKVELN